MDTCGYEKNRRIPDGYGYGYGADIYLAGRVWGSYYPYPTRPVDIPRHEERGCIVCIRLLDLSKGEGGASETRWDAPALGYSGVEVGYHSYEFCYPFASHRERT